MYDGFGISTIYYPSPQRNSISHIFPKVVYLDKDPDALTEYDPEINLQLGTISSTDLTLRHTNYRLKRGSSGDIFPSIVTRAVFGPTPSLTYSRCSIPLSSIHKPTLLPSVVMPYNLYLRSSL